MVFLIVLPFLGALIYLIAEHDGMAQRQAEAAKGQKEQMDDYVRSVAGSGGAAAEIDKAKQLLDSGAITQTDSTPSRPRLWRRSDVGPAVSRLTQRAETFRALRRR